MQGEEKALFLEEILGRKVIDLGIGLIKTPIDSMHLPLDVKNHFACFHRGKCATEQAVKLLHWYRQAYQLIAPVRSFMDDKSEACENIDEGEDVTNDYPRSKATESTFDEEEIVFENLY